MHSTEVYDRKGEAIATLAWHPRYGDGSVSTDREANARLIAAAPELYEALVAAQEELRLLRMKDTDAVYNTILRPQINLALAKARGETP